LGSPTEAELIGRLRDLLQVAEIRRAIADLAAEIRAVAGDGNEPEDIERLFGF